MKTFAVIENNMVINTIICDNLENAEIATGKTCVEYTIENPAIIGYPYANGYFYHPMPEEDEIFPPLQPGDEGYIPPND